jgi:hypothetical protein
MSAYDNPTIIKDETAQAWAQGLSNIGESFTKSFMQARELRDAKIEKERNEQIRLQKESKELLINQQIYKQKYDLEEAEKLADTRTNYKLMSGDLQDTVVNTYAGWMEKDGVNQVLAHTTVLDKDQLNANLKYQKNTNTIMEKDKRVFGAVINQVNGYAGMTASQTMDIAWKGNTPLEKMVYRETCNALNSKNPKYNTEGQSKVSKEYSADPEKADVSSLKVKTDIGDRTALNSLLKDFYGSNATQEELDKAIEEGKASGKISESDGKFKLNFEQTIGDSWDGNFYNEIPKRTKGDLWTKDAGDVTDDHDNLKQVYFTEPKLIVKKEKDNRTFESQEQYIKAGDIAKKLQVVYGAEAKGLTASSLNDKQVLQGYLTNRLELNITAKQWTDLYPTPEDQTKAMAERMIFLDMESRIGADNSSRKATKEEVEQGLTIPGDPEQRIWYRSSGEKTYSDKKTSTGGLTANQLDKKEKYEAKVAQERAKLGNNKDITAVESGDGKKRIAWDPKSENWFLQNKTTGGWSDDLDNPAVHSKSEAAKKYLGL